MLNVGDTVRHLETGWIGQVTFPARPRGLDQIPHVTVAWRHLPSERPLTPAPGDLGRTPVDEVECLDVDETGGHA
jgi:hypothetical protein